MLSRASREKRSVSEPAPRRMQTPVTGKSGDATGDATGEAAVAIPPNADQDGSETDRAATERTREEAVRAEIARRIAEAERKAELDEVSDLIKRAREAKQNEPEIPAKPQNSDTSAQAGSELQPYQGVRDRSLQRLQGDRDAAAAEAPAAPVISRVEDDTRATILLVMQPGQRGIRRINKLADPVICIGSQCYVSGGADRDAKSMSRARVFGTVNTLGARAGACRHKLGCVFRNVEIGRDGAWLQPVDLRLVRHDRRQASRVWIDPTCAVRRGDILCRRPVSGPTYQLWVVPERVARQAGQQALLGAIERGLPDRAERSARR